MSEIEGTNSRIHALLYSLVLAGFFVALLICIAPSEMSPVASAETPSSSSDNDAGNATDAGGSARATDTSRFSNGDSAVAKKSSALKTAKDSNVSKSDLDPNDQSSFASSDSEASGTSVSTSGGATVLSSAQTSPDDVDRADDSNARGLVADDEVTQPEVTISDAYPDSSADATISSHHQTSSVDAQNADIVDSPAQTGMDVAEPLPQPSADNAGATVQSGAVTEVANSRSEPVVVTPEVQKPVKAVALAAPSSAAPTPRSWFLRMFFNKTPTVSFDGRITVLPIGALTGKVSGIDADGDVLTYSASTPTYGSVVMNSDGTFIYTPGRGFTSDTFSITVDDRTAVNGWHIHGLRGLFVPGWGATATTTVSVRGPIVASTPTTPTTPPTPQPTGIALGFSVTAYYSPWFPDMPGTSYYKAYFSKTKEVGATWVRVGGVFGDDGSDTSAAAIHLNNTFAAGKAAGSFKYLYTPVFDPSQSMAAVRDVILKRLSQHPEITAVEIGNELNKAPWTAASYMAYNNPIYDAIKARFPHVQVGPMGLAAFTTQGQYQPSAFLQGMYANGLRNHSDFINVHPYDWWIVPKTSLPGDPGNAGGSLFNNIDQPASAATQGTDLRQVMISNGDTNKKMWITEFGLSTVPGGWSEAAAANYLVTGVQRLAAKSFVGPIFLYGAIDDPTQMTQVGIDISEAYFGQWRRDLSAKPSVALLKALMGVAA